MHSIISLRTVSTSFSRKIILSFTIVFLQIITVSYGQTGSNDFTFNTGDTLNQLLFNGNITASCKDDQGRLLIAGSSWSAMTIIRLLPDGEQDPFFDMGTGPNNWVHCMAVQPDGKIIIAGDFTAYNGTNCTKIARLNTDGSFDPSFVTGTGNNSSVYDIELSQTGKIYLGGDFTTFNSVNAKNLIRLNNDGSVDAGFQLNPYTSNYTSIRDVEELSNGKLVAGGYFNSYLGANCYNLIQLNADGTVDGTFSTSSGTNGAIQSVVSSGSSIFICGTFSLFGITVRKNLVKLNSDGTQDPTFIAQSGINNTVRSLTITSSNELIAYGPFTTFQNQAVNGIVKLNVTGNIISGFDPTFFGNIENLIELSDGTLFCSGDFYSVNGVQRSGITKLNADGSLHHAFDATSGFNRYATNHYVYPDSRILVAGGFTSYNDYPAKGLIRLFSDGSIDHTFHIADSAMNIASFVPVSDVAIQTDGKIIAVGGFTSIGDVSRNRIVRLLSDGTVDTSFHIGTGFNSDVACVVIQSDGKILVGGDFTSYNGSTTTRICRLLPDGTKDPTFTASANNVVSKIKPVGDGRILVCGSFASFNGSSTRKYFNVINENGTNYAAFSNYLAPGTGNITDALALSNGQYIIVGRFNNIGTEWDVNNIARINSNGSVDHTFDYQPFDFDNTFEQIEIDDFGRYLVTGDISTYQNSPANGIIRMYTNGSRDMSFYTPSAPNGSILDVSVLPDSKLLITGGFINYGGTQRFHIAKIDASCYPQDFVSTISSCEPVFDPISNQTITSNTSFIDTLSFIDGCDSIVIRHFIITQDIDIYDTLVVCGQYFWPFDGNTYTTSGDYQATILNVSGCDTIAHLSLTVHNTESSADTQTACESYTWIDGITYYSSTDTPTLTLQNIYGCDSVITLDLTLVNSSTWSDVQEVCDSLTWIDGITYYTSVSGPTWTMTNSAGCDSVITLYLTVTPSDTIIIGNTFSLPSDANTCTGQLLFNVDGPYVMLVNENNSTLVQIAPGMMSVYPLCPGVHYLNVSSLYCADTVEMTTVIPVDSNYVFNNPFIDSLAQDSLGITLENCDIYYAGIDTAYIDSIWANGNTVNVIWNIVDSNGSNFDTTTYELNNGNGVYWLQVSVFCPVKALGDYFTVTEAIYFENGNIFSAGIAKDYLEDIQLYPNPTNDLVTVTFNDNEVRLIIYDTQGKLIRTSQIVSGTQISLKEVETGVYFFELSTQSGTSVSRIVKR